MGIYALYWFFSVFSKLFFSPQLGHFCGLHRASFSNPHLLQVKIAMSWDLLMV